MEAASGNSLPILHSRLCRKRPKVDGQASSAAAPRRLSTRHLTSTPNVSDQGRANGERSVLERVSTRPNLKQSMITVPGIFSGDRRLVCGRRISVTTTVQADIAFGSLLRRHGPAVALFLAGEMFRWHCLSLDSYSHLV